MTGGRSSASQSQELVLACTLVKNFLKDNLLKATSKAFEKELISIQWKSDQDEALEQSGIPCLYDVFAKAQAIPPSPDQIKCQWLGCKQWFPTADDVYKHICNDHVGRSVTGNLTLSCHWQDCGYSSASKRDHLTSHVMVHVNSKPFTCELCGYKCRRLTEKETHMNVQHSKKTEAQKAESEVTTSLKRKARQISPGALNEPVKRRKRVQGQQLDGTNSDSSSITSSSSSSDSSQSSSGSESEVKTKSAVVAQVPAEKGTIHSVSSSSDTESTSSDDSSDSESDVSSSSSDDSDSEVDDPLDEQQVESDLQHDDDQVESNSSGTIEGDTKTALEGGRIEDTPLDRKPATAMGKGKKHVGARSTPLAQQSAKAAPDSHISNAYVSYDYAERAYQDLSVTRGKGFTKEKNKKKRGSYRGGAIDISGGKSFKFED